MSHYPISAATFQLSTETITEKNQVIDSKTKKREGLWVVKTSNVCTFNTANEIGARITYFYRTVRITPLNIGA